MSDQKPARIVMDVDRDGWTKGLQLNIVGLDENDHGWGYRLAGPKYNGSSTNLLRVELTERDATEIRQMLDKAFPLVDAELTEATAKLKSAEKAVDDLRTLLVERDAQIAGLLADEVDLSDEQAGVPA